MSVSITSAPFGCLKDGRAAYLFTFTNSCGASVGFTNYGAALVSALMPDRYGQLGPVTLGFDEISQYEDNPAYIGVVIGPVANRISGAAFHLGGKDYTLESNEGPTCLHSGAAGWHNKLWAAQIMDSTLQLSYSTQDGDGGFPGQVSAQIIISFDDENRLTYKLTAETTAPTPIAMTRHEYFNLTDGGASPIDDHVVQINSVSAAALCPLNTAKGEIRAHSDFMALTALASVKTPKNDLLFDTHYIVDGQGLRQMARVHSPASGRCLDVFGTADGVQFYTGQHLPRIRGASGTSYGPSHGFALEAQARPNAVNHAQFPSVIISPDNGYEDIIIYHFGLID